MKMENVMKNRNHKGPFLIAPHKRKGKLTRKFFDNCKQAEQFAMNLERKYKRGELAQIKEAPKSSMIFSEAVRLWTDFQHLRVRTHKKRPVSLATDIYRLKEPLAVLGRETLTEIDEEKLTQFQVKRLELGRSPATINSDVIAIKKVLNWAKRKGHISEVPTIEKISEVGDKVILPTIDEVMRIIDALPDRLKLPVRFMAETGCRSGETFNLTWKCIDFEERTVEIRPTGEWTPKTKSSERRVFISGKLISILKRMQKDGDYVFPGKISGRPIQSMKRAFAAAVKKANIIRNGKSVPITPKTLRKAYATWQAVDNNVPEPVLQALLGHAPGSQVTARYYVNPQEEAKRKAVFQLPESGNKLATDLLEKNPFFSKTHHSK